MSGDLSEDRCDYLDRENAPPLLQICLQTTNSERTAPQVIQALKCERILDNNLSGVPIAIENGDRFQVIHPPNFAGEFPRPRELR